MADQNAEYNLAVRFDDQSPSFAMGFECGTFAGKVSTKCRLDPMTIHSVNKAQIQALADHYEYDITFAFVNDDWLTVQGTPKSWETLDDGTAP